MTVIERMARAIADRRGSKVVQYFHRADARAALEALREEDLLDLLRDRRFTSFIGAPDENGCLPWLGPVCRRDGYGHFNHGPGTRSAHRLAYERVHGAVPKGLVIDHICRNRRCVNPAHLRAITNAENVLIGDGPTAKNSRKTHCLRGHPYTEENLYVDPSGQRHCRPCSRVRNAAFKRRKRASAMIDAALNEKRS